MSEQEEIRQFKGMPLETRLKIMSIIATASLPTPKQAGENLARLLSKKIKAKGKL